MAASGTHLRCVARINANNTIPLRFSLVHQERAQLRKRPGVQATVRLASAFLGLGADVVQVLNHNGDVDLIYFDSMNTHEETEKVIETQLRKVMPNVLWSIKNQARMHVVNGHDPYTSMPDNR